MTFDNAWVLALLAIPIGWTIWEWRKSYRRAAILLKALTLALIILALSEPRLSVFETKVAVAVLEDSSGSVPQEQIARENDLLRQIAASRGSHSLRAMAFADTTRPAGPAGAPKDAAGTGGTDIESAIRNAMATLPPARVPRIVLISDGNENLGSVERAVYQAREREIPIDTIPLEGRPRPEMRLTSLTLPSQVFLGEPFSIQAVVESPRALQASVQLTAEGNLIGASKVYLKPGENVVHLRARLTTTGATLMSGQIDAGQAGSLRFERSISLAQPRAILISGDTPENEQHLAGVLAAGGFELTRVERPRDLKLENVQLVVANNQDMEQWPAADKQRVADYVREGGGFIAIAGENNLYVEDKGDNTDPLRRMLPAIPAPPRTPEGTAVVLILDKSSSMEGKKMQLARQSAIGLVDNLRPIDQVGVLVFDNSFQWAVNLQPAEDREAIKRSISSVIADGGTQIAPALHEAYRAIRPSKAVYKHILLLTDGISEEGDSIALAREAAKLKITISTIGLGQDVNRAYLERVAEMAEGKSYFLIDVSSLEQLVLRDVMEHTGTSVMEKSVAPAVDHNVEILNDVNLSQAGPLLGWVRFEAKPAAETILKIDENDPLLIRWQYGLGRSAVFASDAKARWAANWVEWPGFDRFWSNVFRDLLPRTPATDASVQYDSASGELLVRYDVSGRSGLIVPEKLPDLYVLGPGDFKKAATLERSGATVFEARVPLDNRFGLFRARAASDLELFPEVGFFRENQELAEYGSNPELLKHIAEWTGGRYNPEPAQVFDAGGRRIEKLMDLWPGLLALAILLNLIELLTRKGWVPWLRKWA